MVESFLYSLIKDRIDLNEDEYRKAIQDYDLIALTPNGELSGVVMVKGNEVHVAVKAGSYAITRGKIKEIIGKILDDFGIVKTSVINTNERGHCFVKRFGFVEVSRNELSTDYEMKECKYV